MSVSVGKLCYSLLILQMIEFHWKRMFFPLKTIILVGKLSYGLQLEVTLKKLIPVVNLRYGLQLEVILKKLIHVGKLSYSLQLEVILIVIVKQPV